MTLLVGVTLLMQEKHMNKQEYKDHLRGLKNGMFSIRKDCTEAFDYALGVAKAEGMTPAAMTTVLMVYQNTLLESLAKSIEVE